MQGLFILPNAAPAFTLSPSKEYSGHPYLSFRP